MTPMQSHYSPKELATVSKFMAETTEILRRETAKLTSAETPPVHENL